MVGNMLMFIRFTTFLQVVSLLTFGQQSVAEAKEIQIDNISKRLI